MSFPKNLPKQNVKEGILTKLFPKGKYHIWKATTRDEVGTLCKQ